jgi:hypothetical protein
MLIWFCAFIFPIFFAMKAIFILSCIAVVAFGQNIVWRGDYDTLPSLPGLDFVGFGYDARFADLSDALQVPIMDYAFTKHKVILQL